MSAHVSSLAAHCLWPDLQFGYAMRYALAPLLPFDVYSAQKSSLAGVILATLSPIVLYASCPSNDCLGYFRFMQIYFNDSSLFSLR